ncbi:hypothetical protein V495_08110 [Pseudogymnoascus sp. VKM F-4514 (FW-929)]|nr:hypothetical protein V490_05758 [Pseudogymnoascus sp. VKM F-3557]KFY34798.1 hypothetical protein V495_08110 [Pseudogymnoascus sp. VKM F-4514 (FW-929)]KFY57010.1 hypothetical protein V497_05840 [Pseudogymnoascus sp. VKM F-4516 (FW-969)]
MKGSDDTDDTDYGDGCEDTIHTLYDVEERETDTRLLPLLTSISRADDPATDTERYDDVEAWDETAIYADPGGFDEAAGIMAAMEAEEEYDREMGPELVALLQEMKGGAAPPEGDEDEDE